MGKVKDAAFNCFLWTCVLIFTGCKDVPVTKPSVSKTEVQTVMGTKPIVPSYSSFHVSKDSLISRLAEMETDTLDCSAIIYWKIIQKGRAYIPALIDGITDTTMTSIYNRCEGENMNIGELCNYALNQIAEFPGYAVTHIQCCTPNDENGCSPCNYVYNNAYKPEYQQKMKQYYEENRYVFKKFKKEEMNACQIKYGITGKLKLQ